MADPAAALEARWNLERRARELQFRAISAQAMAARVPGGPAQRFDCIVVGAGPAGSTAAYFLARAGLDVLLLERAPYPGAKNVAGGGLYAQMVEPLFPGFAGEAPLEGAMLNQEFWLLSVDGALSLGVRNLAYTRQPLNRFTFLKARFDPWLAAKAVRAGAKLLVNHRADRVLRRGRQVVGVAGDFPVPWEFTAPVTIIAEGAAAILASRAGLVPKPKADDMSLYVKEVIALPGRVIRDRFGLEPGQSAAIGFFGDSTAFIPGTASLYTGLDTVGINAGAALKKLREARLGAQDLIARFKRHPFVRRLLAGGATVERTAHLIPDGGFLGVPRLVHPGALIAGDTAGLVNGTQGANLAMYSGKFAADAVIEAHRRGDFSERGLALYQELLDASFVLTDLNSNERVPRYYESHRDILNVYPKLINELAYQVAMVYPLPKRRKRGLLLREAMAAQDPLKTARDALGTLLVAR